MLAELIQPVAQETFFSQHWENNPLLVKHRDANHYARFITVDDVDAYLARNDIPNPDVRLVRDGQVVPFKHYARRSRRSDTLELSIINCDKVYARLDAGDTVVIDGLHRSLPGLSALTAALENELRIPVQANAYLTPPQSQGFSAHWDTHDVMILQISGTKHWSVYDSPIQLPSDSIPFDKEKWTPTTASITTLLEPGDFLYLPRGFIHEARSTNTFSLHVTVGLVGGTWVELLQRVTRAAERDVTFRRFIPRAVFTHKETRQQFTHSFQAAVAGLLQESMEYLLDAYEDNFVSKRFPHNLGRLLDLNRLQSVTGSTILRKRECVHYTLKSNESGTVLTFYGKQLQLPSFVDTTLRNMLSRPTFCCEELPSRIDLAGKLTLARRLIREGLLTIVGY